MGPIGTLDPAPDPPVNTVPCPLCGYDAPTTECPHCGLEATDPSLRGAPRGVLDATLDGFRAVPKGLFLILSTRGVKRFLVPPVLITGMIFTLVLWWALSWALGIVDAAVLQDPRLLEIESEWLRRIAAWIITKGIVVWAAKLGTVFVVLLTGFLVVLYVGSVVYEAIAGPFLDEVQGRIEKVWFGNNPRDEIERPTALPVAKCVQLSILAGIPALFFVFLWWLTAGLVAWFLLLLAPVPFLVLGFLIKDYGTWLGWVVRVEGHTLWVSIKASILAGIVLIPAMILKFVPVIGLFLFAIVAGFATALTLLDIPFSRRQWPLGMRLKFVLNHILPMIAYGIVAGLLFVVPLFGPILMVPAASVGGLWLVCRLDKNSLRPRAVKIQRPIGKSGESAPAA